MTPWPQITALPSQLRSHHVFNRCFKKTLTKSLPVNFFGLTVRRHSFLEYEMLPFCGAAIVERGWQLALWFSVIGLSQPPVLVGLFRVRFTARLRTMSWPTGLHLRPDNRLRPLRFGSFPQIQKGYRNSGPPQSIKSGRWTGNPLPTLADEIALNS